MNILFINMPIRVQAAPNIVPTGIGILVTLARTLGHHCHVLDLNIYRPTLSLEEIQNELISLSPQPDLVALSGMITTLRWQQEIARLINKLFSDVYLVSGGGLASDFGETLFEWIPQLQGIAIGEGETIFHEFLDRVQHKNKLALLSGPEVFKNLDQVPKVDWDSFEMKTYLKNPVWGAGAGNSSWTPFEARRSINLISSRGCPYNCHFCDRHTTGGRNYRLCSAERLMADVREVKDRFDVDFIGFVDDNFLSNRERLETFLPEMEKTGIIWGCHGRLNEIDDDLAGRLKDAGCVYIGFGGESADPGILKRMNKKNSPEQMSKGVRICQQHGITPNCTWIMGYPGETRETLHRTCKFIMDHELDQKNMFVATAYPGTVFFEEVKNKILSVYNSMESYVLDLDDASKTLVHNNRVLQYSSMGDNEFLDCCSLIKEGRIEQI